MQSILAPFGGPTRLTSKTPPETGQETAAPVRTRVSRIDGRRLRSERTRQLIIEAYLALLWRNQRTREGLLFVLGTLVSFESWDQMRSCFNLSNDAAQAAWRDAIDRLLPPTPGG